LPQADFRTFHIPALERDGVKHNVILGMLEEFAGGLPPNLFAWTGAAPGHCAMQAPARPIILGCLQRDECHRLAEETVARPYPGVVGSDRTADWFVEHATELGLVFQPPIPQRIYELNGKPVYPEAPGHARQVAAEDVDLLTDWFNAFHREAVPHELPPRPERLQVMASSGRFQFWIADGKPVSMAGIVRETRHIAAIAGVYTPPPERGQGYAGSVTAAVADRVFARGKSRACLYTDLRNPFSNRCYTKVGFTPVCSSTHFPRSA
jgi:RimJ/RimL family protein N-acetyltransferase